MTPRDKAHAAVMNWLTDDEGSDFRAKLALESLGASGLAWVFAAADVVARALSEETKED